MLGASFLLTLLLIGLAAPKPIEATASTLIELVSTGKYLDVAINNPNCSVSQTIPNNPEYKRYTFKNCITAEFSAYLALGTGNFFELKNGVVDENFSNCYGGTSDTEPQLVINFGQCATLALHVKPQKPYKYDRINWWGVFATSDGASEIDSGISYFRQQPCLYYASKFERFFGFKKQQLRNKLITKDLNFEIHRSTQQTILNKCQEGEEY